MAAGHFSNHGVKNSSRWRLSALKTGDRGGHQDGQRRAQEAARRVLIAGDESYLRGLERVCRVSGIFSDYC
jgi:hypothetical protein